MVDESDLREKPAEAVNDAGLSPKETTIKINLLLAAVVCLIVGFILYDAVGVNLFGGVSNGNVNSNGTTTTLSPDALAVIVLNDKRCDDCDVGDIVAELGKRFPGINVVELDYSSDEGRSLYDSLELAYLPAILFDKSVKDYSSYATIQEYVEEKGRYYLLRVGVKYDPRAEVCDNRVDDNGDGMVDCDDSYCKSSLICDENVVVDCAEPYNITAGTVIFYYSNGCGYCQKMKPLVEELQGEGYSFYWSEVSADETRGVIEKCLKRYITSNGVPQFICINNAKIHVGAMSKEVLKKFADDCIAS